MSFYQAGAWWTSTGQAFASQAEADAYEKNAAAATDDGGAAFAAAMGRGNSTGVQAPASNPDPNSQPNAANPGGLSNNQISTNRASLAQGSGTGGGYSTGTGSGAVTPNGGGTDYWKNAGDALVTGAKGFFNNPVTNPTGWALTQGGKKVDNLVGANVSGYVQDPLGQGLSDLGAPDAVQAIANPTGYVNRNAINAGTGYGTNPAQVFQNAATGINNVSNDTKAAVSAVKQAVPQIPGIVSDIARRATQTSGGGAATAAPQIQQPTLSMTPQQIMGTNTNTVRPSSAQQDSIVNQMLAQSQVQSGYQDFNSPQYNQTRGAAMGYTSNLAGLANNNVAVQGLNGAQYNQSRGLTNQITGQLQDQSRNDVADIQANSAQRDASRASVLGTANQLRDAAYNNVDRIDASQAQRLGAEGAMVTAEQQLMGGAMNNVQDIQANRSAYNPTVADQQDTIQQLIAMSNQQQQIDPNIAAGRGVSNDIIQQLIAQAQQQEGPSAAESLMMNAQERAIRNAYGDAASVGGGWRSQLTGQRQAMGRAAAQQADIAAQMGALRANEAATFRGQAIGALGTAGGLAGDVSARDLQGVDQANTYRGQSLAGLGTAAGLQGDISAREAGLSQSDAALLAQIRQGNQSNTLQGRIAAGNLAGQRLTSDTGLAISDADRAMLAAQGNQQNRLNALLGEGNLETGAMQSDTGLAQSNASLLAQVRQGNQANALASLSSAGNVAGNTLNADLGFASADADVLARREIANQSNATNAMSLAAQAANQTAQLDANIGTSNADRRSTVDQNNRANSIAALQNAGVLSSNTRAQDVQLSVADSNALTQRISAASSLAGTQFASQMQAAIAQGDQNLKQQQLNILKQQQPKEYEKWLAAAGSAAAILGVFL